MDFLQNAVVTSEILDLFRVSGRVRLPLDLIPQFLETEVYQSAVDETVLEIAAQFVSKRFAPTNGSVTRRIHVAVPRSHRAWKRYLKGKPHRTRDIEIEVRVDSSSLPVLVFPECHLKVDWDPLGKARYMMWKDRMDEISI